MTDIESTNKIELDQFYQKEKQVEKKQVSIYLDIDVIDSLKQFGKQKGKGAKSDLVNNFLKNVFGIRQGKQIEVSKTKTSKTAEQMISLVKDMENGERNKFLEYLFHAHFDSRTTDDYDLATLNQIEDNLDRDLTEEEMLIMNIAYGNGYFRGGKDGIDKVLKGYSKK
ncbi:hypothetical protein [Lysinibacillus sp. IITD104]|uniref:hypothetical protein n=1 Tax=unclassified Lysinibacillus TaxID=2636778 RepID=UPI002FD4B214